MSKKTNRKIEQYEHSKDERTNIPHVGLVTPESDPETGEKKTYEYDPHLDPQLQWAEKKEHTTFEVPTVSLHVHERIDPKTIIETVKKDNDDGGQISLFSEKKPLREAIDFYKHKEGWTNRLIAGDSLLVMNSLLEKEGMGGKVQMVYFDPPYGIQYGSNFQPFTNKRNVDDKNENDISSEPEMIRAFRDTWELGIHSYLKYLRDRILLAHELLSSSGSIFFQIGEQNVHYARTLLDEIFGSQNFVSLINIKRKINVLNAKHLGTVNDYIVYYAKDINNLKFRKLFEKQIPDLTNNTWSNIELENGEIRKISKEEKEGVLPLPKNSKVFASYKLAPSGFNSNAQFSVEIDGKKYIPPMTAGGRSWKTNEEGMKRLVDKKRVIPQGETLRYKAYFDDFPYTEINHSWEKARFSSNKKYVVETAEHFVQNCLLMSTDPGDLVLDITCGSGTTACVAEEWGRRWITCDTSRIALTLAKQRIMSKNFNYYKLAYDDEGVSSGFKYKKIPHLTLKSVANDLEPKTETLLDQPICDLTKSRISGPFTVEAVPSPSTLNFSEIEDQNSGFDTSISRSGETNRQSDWRDELLKSGVRAKSGNIIEFTRVEPISGTKYIQAEAETKEDVPKRVLVVFGPEHAPLEQRTVENAWQEARSLKPDMLLFCAFAFDEEAAKDIDELTPSIAGMTLIKAQMNADLLTDDLRKKRSSNESFWLVGQPDIQVHKLEENKIQVEVMGFDYYNPKTGNVESGGKKNIAMWMLDTDYDNRSLFPSQVFFPMSGNGDGWDKLSKNLKSEIDEEKIESFKGTLSLPFEPGSVIAVKIIDDRGIESLRVLNV